MVGSASSDEGASLQRDRLDPGTPQPQKLEASEPPDDESRRNKRRRKWQAAKILESRAKQRQNRNTISADRSSLTSPCPPAVETRNAPPSAYLDHAAGLDESRPHNRTPGQWKTILELQLCAGCLTRTIPPHKPKDERAPCKDLPSVPYDEVYIAAIRKGLAREEPPARRKGNVERVAMQSGGRKQQRIPAHAPPYGDNRTPHPTLGPDAQYGYGNPSQHIGSLSYGGDEHGKSLHAPLYNFGSSSSYHPYRTMPSPYGRHSARPGTGSRSSITLEPPERAELVPEDSRGSKVLKSVNTQPVTPPKQSVVDIDMLGMTPVTPFIPAIHVEGATELAGVASHPVGLLPDSDISALMPPRSNDDRDWDSVTNVAEAPEEAKLLGVLGEDESSSKSLVEKLLGETKVIELSVERSWTLKGLCPSLVSHSFASMVRTRADVAQNSSEWDDATMVEEPQEFSFDFDSFNDKVRKALRPVQSAESFFATRQGTFWV